MKRQKKNMTHIKFLEKQLAETMEENRLLYSKLQKDKKKREWPNLIVLDEEQVIPYLLRMNQRSQTR